MPIKTRADKIREFILSNVERHPADIVSVATKKFGVTSTTVYRHIGKLIADRKLYKSGSTNNATYSLRSAFTKDLFFKIDPNLDESEIWAEHYSFLKKEIPPNIYRICEHGFTEMVNNAKDHSGGKLVGISSDREGDSLVFRIFDDGVGLFKKIQQAKNLASERDAVLELTKGKFTTDPDNHSGEGIFFTSRAFDRFSILANSVYYCRDNEKDDWLLESQKESQKAATMVMLKISIHSDQDLGKLFAKYTDPETHKFNRTHIYVQLAQTFEDGFVSRSQAKRILTDLEKFEVITLDFKNITSVGQAFVDEIFRVFQNKHPKILINYIHVNGDVEFMIKRGIATGAG